MRDAISKIMTNSLNVRPTDCQCKLVEANPEKELTVDQIRDKLIADLASTEIVAKNIRKHLRSLEKSKRRVLTISRSTKNDPNKT